MTDNGYASDLRFTLNGRQIALDSVDPSTLLVDYLRSPDVGLTGTKKGCGQGGCGLCTVMLTFHDPELGRDVHRSINSCMHPIAALDGMAVTTVEGTGDVATGVSRVQWEVAANNGSQCGYCTPGWVMTMHSYLAANQGRELTPEEIEAQFDGNLCRCTGFRPILEAMRHFAAGWEPGPGTMKCQVDPADRPACAAGGEGCVGEDPDCWRELEVPAAPAQEPRRVAYEGGGYRWYRPATVEEALHLRRRHAAEGVRMVVGNTSIGIYDRHVDDPKVFVDISQIGELRHRAFNDEEMVVGGACTYSELIELIDEATAAYGPRRGTVEALGYMAHRTAGHIVRNAASLAGNTMLVLRHIASQTGPPFPSDAFTAYVGLDATVVLALPDGGQVERPILEFAAAYADGDPDMTEALIVAYRIPMTPQEEVARSYKVAIRHENSHSVVNAMMTAIVDEDGAVHRARIALGGIGAVAWRAHTTEEVLMSGRWDEGTLAAALEVLTEEVHTVLADTAERMAEDPWDGFSDEYRVMLAQSYLYQFFVHVAERRRLHVPVEVRSAGRRMRWPISRGTQTYEKYPEEYPVNEPFVKLSAFLQATGEARYTHDLPLPRNGLQAALVTSARAHAHAHYQVPDGADWQAADRHQLVDHLRARYPGFHSYVTAADVIAVGGKFLQGFGSDEPLLCPIDPDETADDYPAGLLQWHGQQIGIVVADDERLAQDIAWYVANKCLAYEELEPLLHIQDAIDQDSIFADQGSFPSHIWKITRQGSDLAFANAADGDEVEVDGLRCMVFRNEHHSGAQIHFYMETQSALAERREDGTLLIHPSSQSPDSITSAVADTLGLPANKIHVRIKRLGGAYGGKTTRSPFTAAWAALAAWRTGRPVRLAVERAVDTAVVGRRHPLFSKHAVAVATGDDDPAARGLIKGVQGDYWFDGGNTYDASFVVMDCLQLRSDTAYHVPNYQSVGEVARTNKTSNTAFRAFGLIQSLLAYEDSIERAAHSIGMLAEDVREKNLYRVGQTTPYGQRLEYCYMPEAWRYARRESHFDDRLAEVEAFNAANRWRKRGISLIPLKYGSGYNLASLEQGGALLEVFKDGTIMVRHGGVEMGQGVMTKVAQIAAYGLGAPLALIQMGETDTWVVPNPTSTGASTGTALNGGAVLEAATRLRRRLEHWALDQLRIHGDEYCKDKGIDFWNYQDGWRHASNGKFPVWDSIVKMAFNDRVNLSAQVRYRQHGGELADLVGAAGGLSFHPCDGKDPNCHAYEVDHFVGFTYSAACSEVEVDVLTGEVVVRRSDIYYDMGRSINPAIDVGQVEGAFVQGLGYVLTEDLVFQPTGPTKGVLNSVNTWGYKPPAHSTIPRELNVHLYPREDAAEVADNPNDLLSAKEVGEPPLVLAITAFFGVKRALLASREERDQTGWFRMDAPATVEQVRRAANIDPSELRI